MATKLYLLRHGETAWSLSGQHTGLSEILLTLRGEEEALRLSDHVQGVTFMRALAVRWSGLPIAHGSVLDSSTASMSVLGYSKNHGRPLIKLWNKT